MGKEVAVEGQVSEAAWSSSGKVMQAMFAEATSTKFMAVVFLKTRAAMDKAFNGDVAKAINGKRVRVIGKVVEYKGKPEIVIDKPEQLEILTDAPAAGGGSDAKTSDAPKSAPGASKSDGGAKPTGKNK